MTEQSIVFRGIVWSLVTIAFYLLAKRLHRHFPQPATMPLITTPLMLFVAMLLSQTSYSQYLQGTRWILLVLGPATVAFAVPIYEQRDLVRAHWPELFLATTVGSLTSMLSGWALADGLGLSTEIRLCLLPRSMSTPFALEVSERLGAAGELTAVFVVLTGLLGTVLGDLLLQRFASAPPLSRGALFGMGAHAAGTARAHQLGPTEGAVAGLVMVLVGLLNVITAPLLARLLS